MAGHGIMHPRLDAALLQPHRKLVPTVGADDEEMVDVPHMRALEGELERQPRERRMVARGQRAATVVHRVEAAQQYAPDGGLQLVESKVEPDLGVHVLVETAV